MLNFEIYLERVEKVKQGLEGLDTVILENLPMSKTLYGEMYLYYLNPFKISGNVLTPLYSEEAIKRIIEQDLNLETLNKLLFPICVNYNEINEKEILNPNVKIAILISIIRRRLIEEKLNEIYQEQREALSNQNVVKRLVHQMQNNNQ